MVSQVAGFQHGRYNLRQRQMWYLSYGLRLSTSSPSPSPAIGQCIQVVESQSGGEANMQRHQFCKGEWFNGDNTFWDIVYQFDPKLLVGRFLAWPILYNPQGTACISWVSSLICISVPVPVVVPVLALVPFPVTVVLLFKAGGVIVSEIQRHQRARMQLW